MNLSLYIFTTDTAVILWFEYLYYLCEYVYVHIAFRARWNQTKQLISWLTLNLCGSLHFPNPARPRRRVWFSANVIHIPRQIYKQIDMQIWNTGFWLVSGSIMKLSHVSCVWLILRGDREQDKQCKQMQKRGRKRHQQWSTDQFCLRALDRVKLAKCGQLSVGIWSVAVLSLHKTHRCICIHSIQF